MSKSSKSQRHPGLVTRPNEGVGNIDVIRNIVPMSDGTSTTVVEISLANAPVPDRRYVADAATVIFSKGTVKLVFAQETITETLRSMLIIQMSTAGVRQFLSSLKKMNNTDFDTLVKSLNIEHEELFTPENEPEQTVALAANMVATAISGNEACLDFYSASAFVMANLATSNKVPVDPVVRVDLRTSLMVALVEKLRELEHNFLAEPKAAVAE